MFVAASEKARARAEARRLIDSERTARRVRGALLSLLDQARERALAGNDEEWLTCKSTLQEILREMDDAEKFGG